MVWAGFGLALDSLVEQAFGFGLFGLALGQIVFGLGWLWALSCANFWGWFALGLVWLALVPLVVHTFGLGLVWIGFGFLWNPKESYGILLN